MHLWFPWWILSLFISVSILHVSVCGAQKFLMKHPLHFLFNFALSLWCSILHQRHVFFLVKWRCFNIICSPHKSSIFKICKLYYNNNFDSVSLILVARWQNSDIKLVPLNKNDSFCGAKRLAIGRVHGPHIFGTVCIYNACGLSHSETQQRPNSTSL